MSVLRQDINISYSLVKEHERNFLVKTLYITFFALYDKCRIVFCSTIYRNAVKWSLKTFHLVLKSP